mgnify:CR=1 FL=1
MKTLIFDDSEFEGGTIHWNNLQLDDRLSLDAQLDDLWDDMVFVSFPSGCGILVGWLPEFDVQGEFVVSMGQNPDLWEPLREGRCRSIQELRRIVKEYVEMAKTITRRYILSHKNLLHDLDRVVVNDLAFDMTLPLSQQLDRLHEALFEAHLLSGHVITIGWIPSHSPSGRFVLTLYDDPAEWDHTGIGYWIKLKWDPKLWRLLLTKECRSIDELKLVFEEVLQYVRDLQQDEQTT